MDLDEIVKTLHPLEIKILHFIDNNPFNIANTSTSIGLNEAQIRSGVNWLEGKELIQKKDKNLITREVLTEKGQEYKIKDLPEMAVYNTIKDNKNSKVNDIMNIPDYDRKDIGSAFGTLKKNNEIIQNTDGSLSIADSFHKEYYSAVTELLRSADEELSDLSEAQKKTINQAYQHNLHKNFFKHKETEIYTYILTDKGRKIKAILVQNRITGDEISQITPEILKEKTWKNKKFREYNINLPAPHILIGKKNAYREFLDFLKYKFVGLGFEQMSGSIVETEFWNMDALFMPQTHPARDIHDVYYVKEPKLAREIPEPFFTNVAKTHENGYKTHSRGWGYEFSREKARQLILRSQGTVLSARQLAVKPKIPGKYFSIARCFRYDKVDATHLADFFQVEGIVISNKADFPTLLGLLELFAKEIAKAKEVKYVPGYFPFTEPSVEMHIKHPKLGWYELGGAGIFRPEVTIPLGVDVPVIAWGLGVDRMAMMALGINDIRDLFSRDIDLIRDTRMVQ